MHATRLTIALLACLTLSACGGGDDDAPPAFSYGVASGDPLQDRVVLWTRLTPEANGWTGPIAGRVVNEGDRIEILSPMQGG